MSEQSIEEQIEIITADKVDVGNGIFVSYYPSGDPKRWDASCNDLNVIAAPTYFDLNFKTENGDIPILKGSIVGKVDFIPKGNWYKDPKSTTQVIIKFFESTRTLLDFIDSKKGEIEPPQFYKNITNPKMANFMKRFGFFEISGDSNIPGKTEILAKASDFKEKLREFEDNNVEMMQKRKARAERELLRKNTPQNKKLI